MRERSPRTEAEDDDDEEDDDEEDDDDEDDEGDRGIKRQTVGASISFFFSFFLLIGARMLGWASCASTAVETTMSKSAGGEHPARRELFMQWYVAQAIDNLRKDLGKRSERPSLSKIPVP